MRKCTVQISGMMCGMCEAHVNDAVCGVFAVQKGNASCSRERTVILSGTVLFF